MRPDEQRGALDRFAAAAPGLERYRKLREAWLAARRDLIDRRDRARELAQEADRLKFALNEIDTVDPQPGEDEALVADIVRLSELDALARSRSVVARGVVQFVRRGASVPRTPSDGLGHALESTGDARLRALADQIGGALTVVVDAVGELGDYLDALPTDASALDAKLARQAQLRTLTRKYAADIDGVLQWAQDSRDRLAQLDVSEEGLAALERRVDELGRELGQAASRSQQDPAQGGQEAGQRGHRGAVRSGDGRRRIHHRRRPLTRPIPHDPAALILPDGEPARVGADGIDVVEFGFAAHRGMSVLPLAKSASGGELSRVMLALEVVLAASATGTTMVFDEVDAGVGGWAAVQIGRRLARLARTHQVIVVTHLPQVAAYADVHLVVHSQRAKRRQRSTPPDQRRPGGRAGPDAGRAGGVRQWPRARP